jgi:hypothetical protein
MRFFPSTRRLSVALAGAALLSGALAQIPAAHADWDFTWCWDDPVVVVNGVPVHIDLGIQASAAQVQGAISSANIVVHVQQGATATVLQSNTPDYPATVTLKFDKGGTWKSGPAPIQVVTTFVLKAHAPALNSKETVSTASTSLQAQATIQGSMNLDFSVQ